MVILRKRADVVIAVLDQEWREYVKNHPAVERMDEIGKEIELRLAKMREMAELPRLPEHQKLEMLDMKERIGKLKERNFRLKRKGTGNVRMLIKGNPTMVSPKYTDAFNQLKMCIRDRDMEMIRNSLQSWRESLAQSKKKEIVTVVIVNRQCRHQCPGKLL